MFVVFEAPNGYAQRCFQEYGVVTDASGRVSALYRPFHLIGLELNVSILSAVLRREPTGTPTGFRGDVVSTAKRDLRAGEILDGEGGACVWGKLMPAADSVRRGGLPIGLANRVPLVARRGGGAAGDVGRCADRYGRRSISIPPSDGGGLPGVTGGGRGTAPPAVARREDERLDASYRW